MFSKAVTQRILEHPNIQVLREEVKSIPPSPCVVASGPLTSSNLTQAIQQFSGQQNLFFFDAIAPTVALESIDMSKAFRASRFNRGAQAEGDYINCPMNKEQYYAFHHALVSAQRIALREFEIESRSENQKFFEGCLPIEELAGRGIEALGFGPMRPIGLINPHDESHITSISNYSRSYFLLLLGQ
mgnify:CR=1 FL=1